MGPTSNGRGERGGKKGRGRGEEGGEGGEKGKGKEGGGCVMAFGGWTPLSRANEKTNASEQLDISVLITYTSMKLSRLILSNVETKTLKKTSRHGDYNPG